MFRWLVHSYSSASRCCSCCWTVPPLRLLTDGRGGNFPPHPRLPAMAAGIRPLCTPANGGHPKRRQPYILPPPSRRCHGYREQASISQPISPAPACSSPLSRLERRVRSNVHMLTLRIFQAPRDRRSMCSHLVRVQVLAGSPHPRPSSSS